MARRIPLVLLGLSAAAALVWTIRPSASPLEPGVVAADDTPAPGKAELKTEKQRGSYALGYKIAANMHRTLGADSLDLDAFVLGMREALSGKETSLSAANKDKRGVHTLPSGIQYVVIKQGTGKQPKATDEVKVHYHGTLIDGTVFDSSVQRGEPATFRLDQVIPGWTESVQLMKEGSKWRVFIPPDLAYGANGPPGIGPNATLIFEIELLEVK